MNCAASPTLPPSTSTTVGDAAQFTAGLGVDYKIMEGLSFDADFRFYDQLYARVSARKNNLQLPEYGILDSGVSYRLNLTSDKSKSLDFRVNVNNVLDRRYISELSTANFATAGSTTYRGIDVSNRGFFGLGRTWNASVRYNF